MASTHKELKTLIEHMDSGELILPEIQRDFVWRKNNVLLLFDSLYRGLPIGYMLVWKARSLVTHKPFEKSKKNSFKQLLNTFYGYLLDGQQRLTAIRLVMDGDENYPLMFSVRPTNKAEPDADRFCYKNRITKNDPWYIPVSDVMSGQLKPYDVVELLKEANGFSPEIHSDMIFSSVSKLANMLHTQIGVIDFESDDYRKATELFVRFNSTGKKLNRNDLLAAELALTAPQLVSEGLDKTGTAYFPQFVFTKTFLIHCLLAVHTNRVNFKGKPSNVWENANKSQLRTSWKNTEKGLGRAVEFISGTVKWDSDTWLPSVNSIIPLVYLLSKKPFSNPDRLRARKWLIEANVNSVFSGSVHTKLDGIIQGLSNDPTMRKLISLTSRTNGRIRPEHFETKRRSGAAMAAFVSMLKNHDARDWIKGTRLDGSVIGHNSELQVHHFFPQKLLRNSGYTSDQINTFSNYAIISKETNLNISDVEPAVYIPKLKINRKALSDQCIPDDENLWKVENYDEFGRQRRKLIARKINAFLTSKA